MSAESHKCEIRKSMSQFSLLFNKFNCCDLANLNLPLFFFLGREIFPMNSMDMKVYWNYTDTWKKIVVVKKKPKHSKTIVKMARIKQITQLKLITQLTLFASPAANCS